MRVNARGVERSLFIFLVAVLLFFFGSIFFLHFQERYQSVNAPVTASDLPDPTPKTFPTQKLADAPKSREVTIKDNVLLDMAFTSQAPLANWDATHEETCEEASLYMVRNYLKGIEMPNDPIKVDRELLNIVEWETAYGYSKDVTLKQLGEIAQGYYGMAGATIIKNPSSDDIKRQLSQGRPVIVPAAGKILPNPNFRNGGPIYHMLVIKGYDAVNFITNDPGTRKGNSFTYTYSDLMNAIRDWDATNILNGQRAVLVFE